MIFNLRIGAAAENAFAKMQEKGLSNLRRSRHRLTPGTVKFAAFHVLSIEGEKGLTILDVAEKIQVKDCFLFFLKLTLNHQLWFHSQIFLSYFWIIEIRIEGSNDEQDT